MDDHPLSDCELMHEVQAGNTRALEVVFGRYKNAIFNFSLRILRNRSDAEDITSEVFMTLCTAKYIEKENVKFSTWLFTIARHKCISKIRTQRKFFSMWVKNRETGEEEHLEIPDSDHLANVKIQQKETMAQIQQAINELPLEQKEAIILREFDEMNYEEIAHVLNCTVAKVKILIFRGREALRAKLPSELEEGLS